MDIKVLYGKEKLPIHGVDLVTTSPVAMLRVSGSGYLEARSVFVNNVPIVDFAVVTDTELTLSVPTPLLGRPIRDISVYSSRPLHSMRIKLDFVYLPGQSVSRVEQVVQEFVYLLLGNPNTDVYNPDSGSGLLNMLPNNLGYHDGPVIRHAASVAIASTVATLKSRYLELPRRPLNEQISRAELVSADFYVGTGTISIDVNLYLMDGSTIQIRTEP